MVSFSLESLFQAGLFCGVVNKTWRNTFSRLDQPVKLTTTYFAAFASGAIPLHAGGRFVQPAQVRQEDDESQVGRAPEGQVLASQASDRDQRGQQSGQDELLLHQLQGSWNSSMSFKYSKPHNSGANLET